jgi:type I restriction enzyme S subunit
MTDHSSQQPEELPTGWAGAKFPEICDVVSDDGKKKKVTEYLTEGRYPIIDQGEKFIGGYTNDSTFLQNQVPLIIFGDHTRRFKFVQSPFVVGADGVKLIGVRKPVCAEYVFFALEASRFEDRGYSRHFQFVRQLTLPIAPLPEQFRIIARIKELFCEIDEGEVALQRARQGLDTWRRALLKAAVTGELTRDWREANRPAETGADLLEQILHRRHADWERRRAGKSPKTASGKTQYPAPDLPCAAASWELPKTWAWASLDQITRGDRPSSYGVLQPGADVPGGIPLVRVGDIHDGHVEVVGLKCIAPAIAAEYSRTQLIGGELLITLVGAIGRTAVARPELAGANTARAVGVIPLSGLVNADWVELWFRSPAKQIEMVGKAHEVARKTLNLEDVRAAGIAVPPKAEQDEIVARVEALIGSSELESAASSRDAQALRQSVLKAAFEGRLVPQDLADEPASVMLARLRGSDHQTQIRRRRARTKEPFSHPSLPGLTWLDPAISEPEGRARG